MRSIIRHISLISIIGVIGCQTTLPDEVERAFLEIPETVDYNLHVKPILSDRCFACHGNDKNKLKAKLRLDNSENAFAELPESPGKFAITPGNLNKSELFHRIISDNPEFQMPPEDSNLPLNAREKAILIKWIQEGANYKAHWAFLEPKRTAIPKVDLKAWPKNPIDYFILKELEKRKIQPSVEADKALLLRRLCLDLTGLPPDTSELTNFLKDTSINAYERQIDRLLSSDHFGEKMATDWMDLARFSDTYGYQVDRYRDMSPWRDWVINAFNKNMPYDQFIIWQLAGDLLPNASREQILATAFNRLHPQNMEDGIIDEEFRVENVADRVAVLGDGLMGLTLSCARCHDHKFDPISQKEYYGLFSYFNNINETGQISWDKGTPVPNLLLPSRNEEKLIDSLKRAINKENQNLKTVKDSEKNAIMKWISEGRNLKTLPTFPEKGLIAHFPLNNNSLRNRVKPIQKGKMEREFSKGETPKFTTGFKDGGLFLDGDAWLNLEGIGVFKREDAFSIGLWVHIPQGLKEGVIFHKNKGTMLHAFRGFHLYLKENKLQWVMAHTYPENAIIEHSLKEVPKKEWVHLMVTYDGSSTAKGTKIFINGKETPTQVKKDNLYKDIIFHKLVDIIYPKPVEPNIKIGARWRGKGLKNAQVDDILVYSRALTEWEVLKIADSPMAESIFSTQLEQLSNSDKEKLEKYFLNNYSEEYEQALRDLKRSRNAYVETVEKVKEIMVMQEMDMPRKTFILNRGVYDDYGEEVYPSVPKSIMEMPPGFPKNRLGLAKWLTHSKHPLTARVVVNRYWQNYFGRGLVETTQDFGNQGSLPSHPELLDWLALWFIESNWDIKALQKLIVMSATYRQSSYTSKELLEYDKENIWLARGPSHRLTSEMIRDNALFASGLLNKKIGGESVYPYQPNGLWAMNFDPYLQDTGEKLYRRSLYTMWRRTIPNPTLATFDQPERNVCIVKRQKTNTPLQALVLLNDPTFVEAARKLGENMTRIKNPEEAIRMAYTMLTSKKPKPEELKLLLQLRENEYKVFQTNPQKMKGWLNTGDHPVDPELDPNLIAANAIVASVIMNGDVTITKR